MVKPTIAATSELSPEISIARIVGGAPDSFGSPEKVYSRKTAHACTRFTIVSEPVMRMTVSADEARTTLAQERGRPDRAQSQRRRSSSTR
jgi:hypothetical protein